MAGNVLTAMRTAEGKIGAPYVYGAAGPSTFDCSGLLVYAWRAAGVTLPRTSQAMAKFGTAVKPSKIQPGDLVTSNWGSGPASHVAMYIGGGKVIHAPRPGRTVTVATLDENYRSKVDSIRRVPGASTAGITPADLKIPDLGGLWDWEKGWSKKLLDGDIGGGLGDFGKGVGDLTEAILTPLKDQMVIMGRAMLSVGQFAELLLKLALPSTWVRIMTGVIGVLLLFLGVFFLVREARGT